MRTLSVSLVLVASLGGAASANGFYINEHDAKVTGRGGTSTATDTDPSAIVFNPGGIAVGTGTAISVGAALIAPDASYTDLNMVKTSTDAPPAVLPQFFITSRVSDMFAVGLGLHMPFGLAISWPCTNAPSAPDCTAQTNSPQADIITKQSLRTYFITPSVGVNLNKVVPGLSFGAGLDLVPATVQLEQKVFFGQAEGYAKLGGDAFGIGGRLGVMYRPAMLDKLSLGAMWRSQVNLDFTGKGDFDIEDPYRSQLPADGDISTTLKLPQAFSGGAAYRPVPNFEVEFNAVWVNWAKFDTLTVNLPGGRQTVSPQNYTNTTTLRFGAEYAIPSVKLALRAGYIYDPTPVPTSTISARLPDVDRHDLTIGASYSIGRTLDANLGLLWVVPGSRTADMTANMPVPKGTYDVTAFVASAGLTARFGDK
jgi:long-chain fatty acid transport protein